MNDVQKKIMNECLRQFVEKDVGDLSMDSIAKNIGVSKRTIYENFASKEVLLEKTLTIFLEQQARTIDLDIMFDGNSYMQLLKVSFRMFYDVKISFYKVMSLKTIYPEIAKKLMGQRALFIKNYVLDRLKKSQEEGYISSDLEAEFLLNVLSIVEVDPSVTRFNGVLDKEYGFLELHAARIFCLLRGFATDKGLSECEKFFKEIKNKIFFEHGSVKKFCEIN